MGGAIGDGSGLAEGLRDRTRALLPEMLAFGFRGVLSFWTAGEVSDDRLPAALSEVAASMMLGFADEMRRPDVIARLPGREVGDAAAALEGD